MRSNAGIYHQPVMLAESMEGLNIKPDGVYVDLTFGGGGHAKAILQRLEKGVLFAFDQDPDAKIEAAKITDPRFFFIQGNFRFFAHFLRANQIEQVDGILADLGTSSHQLDSSERGFAARLEGPLDMRMHQEGDLTAAMILNTYTPLQLLHIFKTHGDIKRAKHLVSQIIKWRDQDPFRMISDLKKSVEPCLPKGRDYKYLAKVFQALRIVVNDEMGALYATLDQIPPMLAPEGRLVVIAYHSGEDRPVKHFIKTGNVDGHLTKDFYGNITRPLVPLHSKTLVPTAEELQHNNRARSARMRVATLSSR